MTPNITHQTSFFRVSKIVPINLHLPRSLYGQQWRNEVVDTVLCGFLSRKVLLMFGRNTLINPLRWEWDKNRYYSDVLTELPSNGNGPVSWGVPVYGLDSVQGAYVIPDWGPAGWLSTAKQAWACMWSKEESSPQMPRKRGKGREQMCLKKIPEAVMLCTR